MQTHCFYSGIDLQFTTNLLTCITFTTGKSTLVFKSSDFVVTFCDFPIRREDAWDFEELAVATTTDRLDHMVLRNIFIDI